MSEGNLTVDAQQSSAHVNNAQRTDGQIYNTQHDSQRAGKASPLVIVLILVIVACLIGGIIGGVYLVNTYAQIRDVENSQTIEPMTPDDMKADQVNPIDFASLSQQNSDIYAWIYLPGTNINYPVCQSETDDTFYLTHNAEKKESDLGAIFSESQFNTTSMQDRVTILYGHNGYGDTMFTQLHQFERSEFFDANDKIYVYAPGHVYTYEIVSAFMAGDQHFMGLFNFQSDSDFARFLKYIQNPNAIGANTRTVDMSADSKVLMLSTCNTGALEETGRYVVCGVMVDDHATK